MTEAILARFGATASDRIGHGGEATVYALNDERVLRIFHGPHGDIDRVVSFYDEVSGQDPGFELPRVLQHGEIDGTTYSVERRITGRPLMDVLPVLSGERRIAALDAYLDAAEAIGEIRFVRPYFGEITPLAPIRAATWREFLHARVDASLAIGREHLGADVPSLDRVMSAIHRRIDALPEIDERRLVHGDFFPGNVMIGEDLSISGVIDFGSLSLMGDPLLDVASAIIFLEVVRPAYSPADAVHLVGRAVGAHGAGFIEMIETYRAYYALRLSHSKSQDERLYAWCVRSLTAVAT